MLTSIFRQREFRRTVIFTALWFLLADGELLSFLIGAPTIALAVWLSHILHKSNTDTSTWTFDLRGSLAFIPFFVKQSLVGGWDTAKIAFTPTISNDSFFLSVDTNLPAGLPQIMFVHVLSLLPGTVSVDKLDNNILIHVLDRGLIDAKAFETCERRVAAVFKVKAADTEKEESSHA